MKGKVLWVQKNKGKTLFIIFSFFMRFAGPGLPSGDNV